MYSDKYMKGIVKMRFSHTALIFILAVTLQVFSSFTYAQNFQDSTEACFLNLVMSDEAIKPEKTEIKIVKFKPNEREKFRELYAKELKNKKFYEVRDGFINSKNERTRLGSEALHWFLNERYGKQIDALPKGNSVARANLFKQIAENELSPAERKPWTITANDTRTQNLEKMHNVPLAPENATWGQRMTVMRTKLDIAQFGEAVDIKLRSNLPSEENRPFTTEELELALRSGIAGDLAIRRSGREAESGDPLALLRHWAESRRRGLIKSEDVFNKQAGTATGRPETADAQKAALVYQAALATNDKVLLPEEFPHRMRDYAIEHGIPLETVLEQTPRFGQFVPVVKQGEPVDFMMGAGEVERQQFNISPQLQVQHKVRLDKPVEVAADLFTVGMLKMLGLPILRRYAEEGITPRDNEPLRFVSWNYINQTILPKINEIMKGTGKKYILPTEAQLELAMRMDKDGKPTTRIFPWGNEWSREHSPADPANDWRNAPLVDSHAPTDLLLANTNGTLWQWTSDIYAQDYGGTPELSVNPAGPTAGSYRVMRGGTFWDFPVDCRSADRGWDVPSVVWWHVGFRLARTDDH